MDQDNWILSSREFLFFDEFHSGVCSRVHTKTLASDAAASDLNVAILRESGMSFSLACSCSEDRALIGNVLREGGHHPVPSIMSFFSAWVFQTALKRKKKKKRAEALVFVCPPCSIGDWPKMCSLNKGCAPCCCIQADWSKFPAWVISSHRVFTLSWLPVSWDRSTEAPPWCGLDGADDTLPRVKQVWWTSVARTRCARMKPDPHLDPFTACHVYSGGVKKKKKI